jgi:peptidoglycan/LPS O-acetylase OafA/YrhL
LLHSSVLPRAKANSLPALTGSRFFAAFAVVVWHFGLGSIVAVARWLAVPTAAAPVAVSFFYVLSGAVLTWGCTDADGLPIRPAPTFWLQRAARVLPAYLLALAVASVLFATHLWRLEPSAACAARIVVSVLAALLLVQAFVAPLGAGLNTPGWSVSCEAFFYLLWPGLVGVLRSSRVGLPWRRGLWLWLAALVVPLASIAIMRLGLLPNGPFSMLHQTVSGNDVLAQTVSYFPPFRLPEFLLGVVVGHALRVTPARARSAALDTRRELGLLAALLACCTALGAGLSSRLSGIGLADRVVIQSGLLGPLFALLIWQLARGDGALRRALASPVLLALGEASYALYILQEPMFELVSIARKRLAPAATDQPVFVTYLVLLLLASLAVHRFVELPVRSRILSWFASRRACGCGVSERAANGG